MNARSVDVVVVGAGLMGASAAWHLSRRGRRVAVLEQFDLAHTRGSSHGTSRIFRLAYKELDYVRLALEALPLWRDAEQALGCELLHTMGGLDLGPRSELDPIVASLTEMNAACEYLSRLELGRRFPGLRLPEGWEAIHQPDAGVLRADVALAGLLELASRAGAEVHPLTRVTAIVPENGGATVETGASRWQADWVVVTSAAWSNRLLEPLDLAVPLTVTREHVAYFPVDGLTGQIPFICRGDTFEFYGLPCDGGSRLKVGEHGAGPEVDPDTEPELEQERIDRLRGHVRMFLPGVTPDPLLAETCLYARTPDDDFVIDRAGSVVLGVGFGGHGFKFGAVVGCLLADLIDGKPIPFAERFSRDRFVAHAV